MPVDQRMNMASPRLVNTCPGLPPAGDQKRPPRVNAVQTAAMQQGQPPVHGPGGQQNHRRIWHPAGNAKRQAEIDPQKQDGEQ